MNEKLARIYKKEERLNPSRTSSGEKRSLPTGFSEGRKP